MSWDDIKKEHGGSAQGGGWEAVKAQWQAEAPARAMRQQAEQERQKSAMQLAERGAKTARDAANAIRNGLTRRQPTQAGRNGVGQDVDTLMRERFAEGRTSRQGQRLTDDAEKQTLRGARQQEKQKRASQIAEAAKTYIDVAVPAIAQGAALRIEGPRGQQRRAQQAEEWQKYRAGYDSGRTVETVQAELERAQADAQTARQRAKSAQEQAAGYQANGSPTRYQNTTQQQNAARNSAAQWDNVASEAEQKAEALAQELGYAKTFYLTDKYSSLSENPDFAEKSKPVMNLNAADRAAIDMELSGYGAGDAPKLSDVDVAHYSVNYTGSGPNPSDEYMTDDERAVFNYLYNTGRKADALEYYNALSDTLEMRRGTQIAKDWDNPVERTAFNLGAGVGRWFRGVGQLFTDEALPATAMEYAQGIMNEEAGRAGRIVYSAANSLGNMLPSIVLSAATSGAAGALGASAQAAGYAGKAASTASMFAGAKGNAYTEALRQGMTKAQAGTYSTLIGASEAGLEYLLGGISKLGLNPVGSAAEKWVADLGTGYAKAVIGPAAQLLGSAAGEILEENLQNYLEPIFLEAVTGADADMPGWDEFVETTLSVLITVGVMEGPGAIANTAGNLAATQPEMQRRWVNSAMEVFPEGSAAYCVADALSRRLNNGEAISAGEFREQISKLGFSPSTMDKIRSGKLTLEEVQQAMTEAQRAKYDVTARAEQSAISTDAIQAAQEATRARTAAEDAAPVYLAYGFKEDAANAAAAVTAKLAAGETITNAEVGALRLKTQRGREALSSILGVEIDSPQMFRRAELFYQQGRAAEQYGFADLDVATLPATQESAHAILGNEQALADFERMTERAVSGAWQERIERIVSGLKELQAGRGEGAQTVSAAEQLAAQLNIDNAANPGYTGTRMNGGAAYGERSDQLHGASGEGVRGTTAENDRRMSEGRTLGRGDLRDLRERRSVTVSSGGVVTTEILSSQDSAAFSSALDAARAADSRNGWAVTPKTAEELGGHEMVLAANGSAGAAIAADGDIQAVFRNAETGVKGSMEAIMPRAIELGGNKLDCYGEGLVRVYENYGFVPVARVEFNEEYANPGWDSSKGTPDIYFMVHNGDSAETVAANIGQYEHMATDQLHALPIYGKDGYDEAMAYRDSLLAQRRGDTTSVGAAPSGFDPLSHAANEYGAIPPGENPARVIDIPRSMDGETKVQQGTRTIAEAAATQDVSLIEDATVQGMFNRHGWSFDEMRAQSEEWLSQRTPTQAVSEFGRDIAKHQTAENVAKGILLYADLQKLWAAAENGSSDQRYYHDLSLEVASSLNDAATNAGETLATWRMLKQLNPADRINLLQRSVDKLNTTLKGGVQVELNPDLVEAYHRALRTKDAQAIELAEENLKHDIAAQVPKTLMDRWNAWRYLCMLGNPKTIIRNAAGNAGMTLAKAGRDTIAAGLERLFVKKENRTKSGPLARFSKEGQAISEYVSENLYTDELQATLRGEEKYSQNLANSLRQMIRDQNGTFTAPVLKQWQAATEFLMNDAAFGDAGFLKWHFTDSFVQAALARGYTADEIRSGEIPQADIYALQDYAVQQAQKATFRDLNAFSKLMKKLPSKDNLAGILFQGVLPFRSTPANVAVRSVEYSPVGLAQGLYQLLRYALDQHADRPLKYSQVQAIESISQGTVGTLLFAAGAVLANAGIIHGAVDDDDERKGYQAYSVTIGDKNVTLDWLSPSIVPLMMGAMTHDLTGNGSNFVDALATSAGSLLQPMFEMSMLSGVSDLLDSFRYADSSNDVTGIVYGLFAEPLMNYLSQGIPTLLSQTTQTINPESTYTYTGDIPTGFLKKLTKSAEKMLRKTPLSLVFDSRQAEFVDEWGRTTDKGNVLERFLNNFLNPAYVSDVQETDLDAELERLEEATGDNAAPSRRGYTITVNGERKRLTKDQYDRYSREYGTQAAEMMSALLVSKVYDEMPDEERVEAFKKIGQLADKYGKISAGVGYEVKDGDSDKALFDLVDSGIPVAEAYAARLYRDQLNGDKILDAATRQEHFSAWVSGRSGWSEKQKTAVLDAYGTFFSQTPANTEKYEAAAKIIGSDKAMKISAAMRELQPEQKPKAKYEYDLAKDDTASKTYSSVRAVQKIELIAKQPGISDKDKYTLMALYSTDWRLEEFRQAGLSPKVYAEFLRGKDEYCPSGSWSDKRFAEWLQSTNYSGEVKTKIRAIYNMDKP